jgi:hypothetical protein
MTLCAIFIIVGIIITIAVIEKDWKAIVGFSLFEIIIIYFIIIVYFALKTPIDFNF